ALTESQFLKNEIIFAFFSISYEEHPGESLVGGEYYVRGCSARRVESPTACAGRNRATVPTVTQPSRTNPRDDKVVAQVRIGPSTARAASGFPPAWLNTDPL
ncbi:MAG: hypothetical protein NTW28_23100, partial [Candidatus Solibacter sp.]|nr:hypothetical protein [Candidatus Solibacter sp.]